MSSEDPRVAMFERIGLTQAKALETIANAKFASNLETILKEAKVAESGCDRVAGNHFYTLVSKLPPEGSALSKSNRGDLYAAIADGRIKSVPQITAAINYFKTKTAFNLAEFEAECGVGVVVTPDEIKATIAKIIDSNTDDLTAQRYRMKSKLMGVVAPALKWADGALVRAAYDEALLAFLGPETDADRAPPPKAPKAEKTPAPAAAAKAASPNASTSTSTSTSGAAAAADATADADEILVPPEDYLVGRELEWAVNTEDQIKRMKENTGGRVITRFPPEPNGYLHIGHAKAMAQNFGVAKQFNGRCIMRFDDTNPEAEEKEYIDTILENLDFLGHKPWKVTYSSDYFEELYQLAVKLIKAGKAFVCHQTADQIKEDRAEAKKEGGSPKASPWRDRPIEESLKLFADMRKGKFEENQATLRMRGDLSHPNPNMWDTVFYRIRYSPHPHAGDKWCIYPTYDYTHCIIDSLEYITYSMCTLEFEIRRESYFWLLHELDLYKPKVWEYSRLNITHNVLSKRRLRSLVMENHVKDWDDPRLLTINGLRRRGFTAAAINNFIKMVGVSRNANTIPYEKLEMCARDVLLPSSPRVMVVVDPLKVVLTNFDAHRKEDIEVREWTADDRKDTHTVALTNVVYIEREDFMINPTKDFIRLAPGREARLKGAYNITITNYVLNADGSVKELHATMDFNNTTKKPPVSLHWASAPTPGGNVVEVESRLYDKLFKSEDPMSVDDWRSDLNPDSLRVVKSYADPWVLKMATKPGMAFQFERIGFFVTDPDSDFANGKIVFNRTAELRKATFKKE